MSRPKDDVVATGDPMPVAAEDSILPRRAVLKKFGRFAAVTPPAVTLLLAAGSKRAAALSPVPVSSRQFKNSEGTVDGAMLSSALARIGEEGAVNAIDGVGICLAAIKALNARLDAVEGGLRPTLH
jgi:hypothetical protein